MLVIPLEKLAFIIAKAREFDAEVPVEPDAATGSDGPDDDERQVLLDTPDNPTEEELRDAIDGLGDPERQELLALIWLGRGDYDADSWPEALREARESTIANVRDYLVGTPLLGDYLEEGAATLGLSLEDFERVRPASRALTAELTAVVTEADLERELALVRSAGAGGPAGIFGPDSVTWRIDREAAVFLGAGRALLLQLAHPWVAAALAQHSRSLTDPVGRFHRTFSIVFTMVFGTTGQALAAARRLHRRHTAISGTLGENVGACAAGSPYCANDVAALRWVHATLTDTALLAYQLVNPPLSGEDRERYYEEMRLFAALFGIPQSALPHSWADFVQYVDDMFISDTLAVSSAARSIAAELFCGAGTRLRAPFWYRALTASLLPPRLRDGFELPYGPSELRSVERVLTAFHRVYPWVPARLRYVAPYHEALARLAGARPAGALDTGSQPFLDRPEFDGTGGD